MIGATLLAAVVMAVWAASASAYINTTPNSHDFGSQQVGTASAPFTFTLNVRCYNDPAVPGTCMNPHPFTPNVTVSGEFAIQDNNCTALMPGNDFYGTNCTFKVFFAPLGAGPRTGIVDAGDPDGFGKAFVTGAGVAPPAGASPSTPSSAAAKKCKKGFRLVKKNGKRKCKRRKR